MQQGCIYHGRSCNLTYGQAIELNSNGFFDEISQVVNIVSAGTYLVRLEWMTSYQNPLGKQFAIMIDSVVMVNVITTNEIYNWNVE